MGQQEIKDKEAKNMAWLGDGAMGLAVRHLFTTKYANMPEHRRVADKIVSNKFLTQNTPFGKGDQFEAWVAEQFQQTVAGSEQWKAFTQQVEQALVLKEKQVVKYLERKAREE